MLLCSAVLSTHICSIIFILSDIKAEIFEFEDFKNVVSINTSITVLREKNLSYVFRRLILVIGFTVSRPSVNVTLVLGHRK